VLIFIAVRACIEKMRFKSSASRDITPCSPSKVSRRFGGTCCLHLHGHAVLAAFFVLFSLFYSSTPKMEAVCSSERPVDFQRTTRHHIPYVSSADVIACASGLQRNASAPDSCQHHSSILNPIFRLRSTGLVK
jgi:hypothetical protein